MRLRPEHRFHQQIEMPRHHPDPSHLIKGGNRVNHHIKLVWLDTDLDDGVDREANPGAIGEHANGDDVLLHEPINPPRHRGAGNTEGGGYFARRLPAIVLQLRDDLKIECVQVEFICGRGVLLSRSNRRIV